MLNIQSDVKKAAQRRTLSRILCTFTRITFITLMFCGLANVFAQDFSDLHNDGVLTGWTAYGNRDWSENGGAAVPQNHQDEQGFLIKDNQCANDGTYTVTLKSLASNANSKFGGVVFRYNSSSAFYYVALQTSDLSNAASGNELRLFVNTTDWTTGGTVIKDNLDLSGKNGVYTLKIRLRGTQFTFWLDSDSLGQITDATHASGQVGYAHHSTYDNYMTFDASSWENFTADYIWDTEITSGIQPGSGIWGSDNFWTLSDGDGTTLSAWKGSGNTATFAGSDGSYIISVNDSQGVDSIAFLNTGYTVTDGTIALSGEMAINAAVDATVNSVVDGTDLNKYGSGRLTLGGANTYTGQTNISAGALGALNADALGTTGQGTVVNSGASLELEGGVTYSAESLILNGTGISGSGGLHNADGHNTWPGTVSLNSASSIHNSDVGDLTITGVISGSGSLTKTGTGRLRISGENTYTGQTIISEGDIILANPDGLGATSSGTVVNDGAALTLAGHLSELPDNSTYAAEPLTLNGTGYHSTDGVLRLSGGDIVTSTWAGPITLGSAASIGVADAGDTLIVSSVIDGAFAFEKFGSGTLLFTDANTYSGPTTINSGTLQIGNGASGSVTGDIVNDASLVFHRTGSLSYGGIISGGGAVTKSNTGTVTLTGANTCTGATNVSEGTLVLNGSLSSSSDVTVSSGSVLAGTGDAAGSVTVESGATVAPGDNGAGTLSTGDLVLNSTSELDIQLGTSSDQIAVSGNLTLDGTVNVSDISGFGSGEYTILTYTGSLTDNIPVVGSKPAGYDVEISTATAGSIILSVTTELARYNWDVSTKADFQVTDGIWGIDSFWTLSSADGTVLKSWPGEGNRAVFGPDADDPGGDGYNDEHTDNNLSEWTIAGARTTWDEINNDYCTPGQSNDQGFLINNFECASNGTFSAVIKALQLYNTRYGGLVFRFTDASNYYYLALHEQDSEGQHTSNEIRVFKNTIDWGATPIASFDNLNFAGMNRHYPIKIILDGSSTSVYLNDSLLGTFSDPTHAGGQVGYGYDSQYEPYVNFESSSWANAPTAGSTGPFSITVNGTQSADSVLFTASGYTLSDGTLNLTGVTPAISTAYKATIGSAITGSSGMRKIDTDTLFLTGSCTYTGGTTISEGTLQLGTGETSGSVTGTIENNGTLIVNRSDQLVLEAVSGTGSVIKKSSGTLVFNGNNTYSGGTTLENGTIQVGQGSTTGALSGNVSNSEALVFNRSDSYTYAGVISGTGTVSQNGTGTLVFAGDNTYTGNTTVSSGNFQMDGSLGSTAVTVSTGATLSGTGTIGGSVTVNAEGTLAPGSSGSGKLSTGALSLNGTSVLDIDIGTESDTVAVTGDLVLDGTLDITDISGFREGTYTIITYSGNLTDNTLAIGSAPLGYDYTVTASGGEVKVEIESSHELLPLTVNTTTEQCSVYTDNWTLVFDNAFGGAISVLTDSAHGRYSNATGNQLGDYPLYYFDIDGTLSSSTGSWALIDTTPFYARIRQSGSINSIDYAVDYTIHGSGRIFIKTTFSNTTGSTVSPSYYRQGLARKLAANTVYTGPGTPPFTEYVMVCASDADHFDPVMIIKDLWNADSGAVNTCDGIYVSDEKKTGYLINSPELQTGQRQTWEFMIDFSHKNWSDTTGIGQYIRDYRQTDSLAFLTGTRALEKSWENHLEGHWVLDEGSGSAVHDQSGNSRNGTLDNGTWCAGKYGNALTLGSSSIVSMGDIADFDGRFVFTVMAWIKPSATLSSSSHIFGKHDGSKGYRLTGDNGKLSLVLDNTTLTGSRTLETGRWYHVAAAFSRESGEVYLYVDGRIDRIIEGTYLADYNSASAVIGGGFEGDIDDVRFYGEALSENTLKAVYQRGYRSSEGFYQVRADNNSALHVEIDGGEITRRHPVFEIANYWSDDVPAAGAVLLDGTALVDGTDYYTKLDENRLFLGLNKMISWDDARLYVHKSSAKGAQLVGETRKMKWGVDNLEGTDYFWVKNFEGDSFGDADSDQFYLNWKMSNSSNSNGGEPTFMSTSVSSPDVAIDTVYNTNMIPDYNNTNDSWGQICFNQNGHRPKTTQSVSNTVSYEVAESSSVRLVLNIHERTVSSTESFRVKTRWTVYPTGQIFRYDSLYDFSSAPDAAYTGAFFSASSGVTQYQNNTEMRAGVFYPESYPDFGFAWLGMKNSFGFQSAPFDSDTIMPVLDSYRTGFDFGDQSLPAVWNSNSIETALYLDIQHSSMSQDYIDSVCNSVQYIETGGDALTMLDGSLVTNSTGDLNQDGFNEREGAYVVSASNNTAHFKLPASGDTVRYHPAFRVANYTAAKKPQYVFVYRGKAAGDTLALLEGYQYNMYHNVASNELVFQIDSVFSDTVGIYLSSDVTLAVTLSQFKALPGDGCDTLMWRTESESENLGFHIYRRVKPAYLDSLAKVADTSQTDQALNFYKQRKISHEDSSWVRINKKVIPGAESGVSHGPKDYEHIDRGVYNHLLYEYMLVAVDFSSVNDTIAFAEAMPAAGIPRVYKLRHNYPNPFRTMTTIRFELPVKTRVRLDIYDLKGRLIRRVVRSDRVFKPGSHKVLWDGRDERGRAVASGHYFYRIVTPGFVKTRRMVKF
ncbi:MAG: autotransporter-associated beta strand repeat-containing protein [Chitinispirillaceae bacterium]